MSDIEIYKRYIPKKHVQIRKGQIEDAVNDYFDVCDSNSLKYTQKGLSFHLIAALGIGRKELYNLKNEKRYDEIFSWAMYKIDCQLEQNALEIETHATSFTQFLLKNHSDYEEKVAIDQKVKGEVDISFKDRIAKAEAYFKKIKSEDG